jgi:CHASE3 domain sensor protein
VDRAQSDREQATAARELDLRLASLLVQLRRAETAQLGYIPTGAREYFREFEPSLDAVGPTLDAIKAAVADNPVQLAAIARGKSYGQRPGTIGLHPRWKMRSSPCAPHACSHRRQFSMW